MEILALSVGGLEENTYIYYDENAGLAAVIDPGDEADRITETISGKGLKVAAILLTHGHYDHTGAAEELRRETGAAVYAHEDEEKVLSNPRFSYVKDGKIIKPDIFLKDGDKVSIGALTLSVIHTPGHTTGSCCFYDEENGVLFSGDTLFRESMGRYDFATGNRGLLMGSIRDKLFTLPDKTRVLPGHSAATLIGHEKSNNPFFR